MENRSQEFRDRLAKVEDLRKSGVDPYPNDFRPSDTCDAVIREFDGLGKDELEESDNVVSVAGRIMALRDFGKAAFIKIQDRSGRLQAYVKKNILGEEGYEVFKKADVGDIVGVEGRVFRTRTDELTVEAKDFRVLAKGLSPLPEKWHGLKDVEARYRQRYLDLLVNPDVRDVFLKRSRVVEFLRRYLGENEFVEVETPMLHPVPGGAAARPFVTHHNTLDMDLYMRIAPELYLKRLLIGGVDRVFEINRNFRNEGISTRHNPEFTMLEFYQSYATFEDLMTLTEDMISKLVQEVHGSMSIEYQGMVLDFTPPWERTTVKEAVMRYSDATADVFTNKDKALALAKKVGLDLPDEFSHGKVILEIFEKTAEPELVQPTFVTHYPMEVSPLARKNAEDPSVVDRFELLVMGNEIANAFSELNDPVDQRERFLSQIKEREAGDTEAHLMDDDFLKALEYGMPPAAGEGIGIDRLVMILTDSPSIRDVILFPQLRK